MKKTLSCESKKEHGGHAFKPPRGENFIGVRKSVRKNGNFNDRGKRRSPVTTTITGLFLCIDPDLDTTEEGCKFLEKGALPAVE